MVRSDGGRTEPPSRRRLALAREQGQVAISGDLTTAISFSALVVALTVVAPAGVARILALFRQSLREAPRAGSFDMADTAAALNVVASLLILPLGVALAAATIAGLAQTGGLFAWRAWGPDWSRTRPDAGFGRLWSQLWSRIGTACLKVVLLSTVVVAVIGPVVLRLPQMAGARPTSVLAGLGALAQTLAIPAVLVLAGWGVVDWLLARDRHRRALMTTPEEARREHREAEGDPRHRRERRRLHRDLGERWAVDDVRHADFVVVDADRLAVAVSYRAGRAGGDAVPLLVAKGRRLLAGRIEQTARAWNVPVHHDAALTQALDRVAEGDPIPAALYQAVAEMLRASWQISSEVSSEMSSHEFAARSPPTAWKRP